MTILLWLIGASLFTSFLLIVFRGAPFVPTRSRDIERLFTLHRFSRGDVFVDLGSGDGRILAAAARHGIDSVGYEFNPFLVGYSRWRLRGVVPKPSVRLEDFWRAALPERTVVVFVFLAGPFMAKLDRKLQSEAKRLGHDIMLISYGMKIPDRAVESSSGGYLTYRYRA